VNEGSVNDGWVRLIIMVATFFVPMAVSLVLAPQVERIGRQVGLVDQPGKDRVNTRPLPRTGGVALYLAFLVGLGLTFVLPVDRQFDPYEAARLALLVIGASIVFVVMLADDA
jgi:UDP-GlcNAc:undecaprenyl-phosphate GlcNAc-1-phosphate transferase